MKGYRALALSIALAIVGYGAFALWPGLDETLVAMAKLGEGGLLLVFGLSLVNYAIRFVRWQWYLHRLGYDLPAKPSAQMYLAGFAFTTTPGKAGETLRSLYLKEAGVAYGSSLGAFFAERVTDVAAMLILAGLALWHFPSYTWPVLGLAAALVLLLWFLYRPVNGSHWRRWAPVLRTRVRRALGHLRGASRAAASLLKRDALPAGIVLGVLAWGAEAVAFYYILHFLGVEVSYMLAIGIYAISILIGAVSFLPGGLGSTEAVMVMLLLMVGASEGEAIAATLVCRIATLWFAVLIGMLALLALNAKRAAEHIDLTRR